MSAGHLLVRFKNGFFGGRPLLLIDGVNRPNEGALATPEQWNAFALNEAHLYPEGVFRFRRKVAEASDMEILGECDDDGNLVVEVRIAHRKLAAAERFS